MQKSYNKKQCEVSNFNDKVLCSAALWRYTKFIASKINCIEMHKLSPPSSQKMDLQAQTARFGPFFLPLIIEGHDKTTDTL